MSKISPTEAPLVSMVGTIFHLKSLCHEVVSKPLVPRSLEGVLPDVSGAIQDVVRGFNHSLQRVHDSAPRFLAEWAEDIRLCLYSEVAVDYELTEDEWVRVTGRVRELRLGDQTYPWRPVELILAPFRIHIATRTSGPKDLPNLETLSSENTSRAKQALNRLARDLFVDEGLTQALAVKIPIQKEVRMKLARYFDGGTLTYHY